MCLFATAFQTVPGCPVLALINRDEFRTRPTAAPQVIRDNQVAWVGGTDLQAGGTWLGVNQFGLVVGVTNRRKSNVPPNPRSRGLLCRDLLQCTDADKALAETKRLLSQHEFDGFNLLLLSSENSTVIEAADEVEIRELSPGLHCIGNGPLDDETDRRVRSTREKLEQMIQLTDGVDQLVGGAQQLCALCGDDAWNSICRVGGVWGTVSSTIIALPDDLESARYTYAPGPPQDTPYDDCSPLIQSILKPHT